MKTKSLLKLAVLTGIILVTQNLAAQKGKGYGKGQGNDNWQGKGYCLSIPDLSDEQKDKISQLRIVHLKEVKNLKNELNEKMAKHQTLITADEANLDLINKNIDEITQIKNKLMKAKAAHQQAIRALLTEEQKVYFDLHLMKKGKRGHGYRNAGKNCPHMPDVAD